MYLFMHTVSTIYQKIIKSYGMLPLQATNENALQTSKTTQVREFSPHCIKFAAKQVRHHKIRSLLKFVLPWVASDPKKMHPFRSHEIGRSLHRVDSGRCASFCNGISQRPPVQSLKLRSGALFLGGAMMLDQNFESRPFRRCSATLLAPLRTCPVDKFVRSRSLKIPCTKSRNNLWLRPITMNASFNVSTPTSTSSPPANATSLATLVDPETACRWSSGKV